jgi:Icc-related predicted phosphoesterase
MKLSYFVSDLHGSTGKYGRLFDFMKENPPELLFLGGDLLPSGENLHRYGNDSETDFIDGFLIPEFHELKRALGGAYPDVLLILGNDDPMINEAKFINNSDDLWHYVHNRKYEKEDLSIFGYSFVPPTPFMLKDWEKYDVSRFTDTGSISPEEGFRTVPLEKNRIKYSTIQKDLEELTKGSDLKKSIFLFHSPPYKTNLDKADLEGKFIDHVPLDPNVGSIAIRRFIEAQQPLLTLHGHIHESSQLTGSWKDNIGNTICYSAAFRGEQTAIVRFDVNDLDLSERILI